MDKFKWGTWKEIDVFEILHDLWLLRWLWRESSSTPSLRGRACSDLEIWSLRQTGSGWDHFHHCTICTFFSWTSAKVLSVWLAFLLLEGGGYENNVHCRHNRRPAGAQPRAAAAGDRGGDRVHHPQDPTHTLPHTGWIFANGTVSTFVRTKSNPGWIFWINCVFRESLQGLLRAKPDWCPLRFVPWTSEMHEALWISQWL